MRRRVTTSPSAKRDLADLGAFIRQDSVDAEIRFYEAAQSAFAQLASMPQIGSIRHFNNPRLVDLRMWRVPGFEKHLIFYFERQDGIEIVRVLHGARDIGVALEEE